MRYIALIRGVTPTGKNKVPMAQLRTLLSASKDLYNVQTYIQSGNVILESEKSPADISSIIHDIIYDNFGGDLTVVVKTPQQMKRYYDNYAFKNVPPQKRYYTFLNDLPSADGAIKLAERDFGADVYAIVQDVVYIAYNTKASDSKLTNNVIEQKLGVRATTRNDNTVKKLMSFADER